MSNDPLLLWVSDTNQTLQNVSAGRASSLATQSPNVPVPIGGTTNNKCGQTYVGVCLVHPSRGSTEHFFGFAEFITALTLIAVVFTISDTRYRFRIAVAPIPLIPISYWVSTAIGILVLLSDIWFAERWLLPDFLSDQVIWQGVLGGLFLFLVLAWIYFAFLNPARFGRINAKRYTMVMYRIIVRGDDAELATIADELGRSVQRIADMSFSAFRGGPPPDTYPRHARYAHELLLLIGNRKFCRQVVARAPGTAIALFQRISEKQSYYLPVRQFTKNLSAEAIQNIDSILYHEDEGYDSGLLGYVKPFSAAVFGDYRLVEGLGGSFGSPLDIDYKAVNTWDAIQASSENLTFESGKGFPNGLARASLRHANGNLDHRIA